MPLLVELLETYNLFSWLLMCIHVFYLHFLLIKDYLRALHKHFWVRDVSEMGYKKYSEKTVSCLEYVVSNVKMFDLKL